MMTNTICILIIAFTFSSVGYTQESEKLFAMIYSKGEAWNENISTSEQAYFEEHGLHLKNLRKLNKIVIGGRYSDLGFMLLKARDIKEAESITKQDISVENGTFKVELFEFEPFYSGCIDKM